MNGGEDTESVSIRYEGNRVVYEFYAPKGSSNIYKVWGYGSVNKGYPVNWSLGDLDSSVPSQSENFTFEYIYIYGDINIYIW